MKIIKSILLLSSLLLFLLMSGCEEEACYSCDEEIDSWAKENIAKLSLMSRVEVAQLPLNKQQAAYRTFSAEKRKSIWKDKLLNIKSIINSDAEITHLTIISNFIDSHNFALELTHEQSEFFSNWFQEGKSKFGWTDYFLVSGLRGIGQTVNSEKEFRRVYISNSLSYKSKNKTKPSHNLDLAKMFRINKAYAQTENDCDSDWCLDCSLVGGDCISGSCEETETGCGFLWLQSCTKNCIPTGFQQ